MELAPDLVYTPRDNAAAARGDCTFHHGLTPHMANANDTDLTRFAHIIIYMDAETIYNGNRHVVTDPLGLIPGEMLAGEI